MNALKKMAWIELKLFIREPTAAFFTLVFPVMMLMIFGIIYGNNPTPFFGGRGYIDTAVPAFSSMIIATGGLFTLCIQMASYRESRILRRMKTTPVKPHTILASQVAVVFIMTLAGIMLLIVTGKVIYGLRFQGNVVSVAAGFILSCLSFFALGFVLAGIFSTARSAQIAAMVIFYPMLFLSGAAIPREVLPLKIRTWGKLLPMTHVVNLLRGLWSGEGWAQHILEVGVLSGILIAGVAISSITFRWE
jgi:ABC-2 type transport system permease protein